MAILKLTVVPDKRAQRARSGTHNHRKSFCDGWSSSSLQQLDPVVMGPGLRRDDSTASSASTQIHGISRMAEPISGGFTRQALSLYRLTRADRPPSGGAQGDDK